MKYHSVGEFLRFARESRRLSQDETALLTANRAWQVSRSTISAIERGRNLPSLEALIGLSRVLLIDPAEVIERVERLQEAPTLPPGLSRQELEHRAEELFWAGDFRAAAAIYHVLLELQAADPDLESPERIRLLATYELRRAAALRRSGALLGARAAAERAIAGAVHHPGLQAEAYIVLSGLHRQMGNVPLAVDAARRAVECAAGGSDTVRGRAWIQRGACLWQSGAYEEARLAFLTARELVIRSGDHRHTAHVEGNIGMCHLRLGDREKARRWVKRAVELARRHALPALESSWLVELGRIALEDDDLASADRYGSAALQLARPLEHWLTVFRAEWLRHLVVQRRDPSEPDAQRMRHLRRLLLRLHRHEGDETVREFNEAVERGLP